MKNWSPNSWRERPALHIPQDYPDEKALTDVFATLEGYPPLVFAGEARNLKTRLAAVSRGEAFLLRRALRSFTQTTFATHSGCCFKWPSS